MMRFLKALLSISHGLLLVVVFPVFADGDAGGVTVRVNDIIELRYEERVRLSQVLTDAQAQWAANDELPALNIHWPSARLVHTDRNREIEAKRRQLQNRLNELQSKLNTRNEAGLANTVAELSEQVQQIPLGFQPYREIEFEHSRQRLGSNPLLATGYYQLYLPERQTYVYMYGLNSQPGARAHEPGATLRDYLLREASAGHLTNKHDKDQAWVVRPNSMTTEEPWAYHNAVNTRLQPGFVVFHGFERAAFGFVRNIPRELRSVEDEFIALLDHFLPLGVAGNTTESSNGTVNSRAGTVSQSRTRDHARSQIPLTDVPDHEPTLTQQFMGHFNWQQQDYIPTRNNFGGVGLMQNPTARFAPEGEISLNYTDMNEYRRYSVNLSVLSWVEATAFYARLPNQRFSPDPNFSNDNIYTDKGFDVKFRLWEESYYMPQIALGLRDFAGTGLYDSEFIVANKRFGPFDVSFGMGWGRMGTRDHISNPFCELSDSFCERRELYAWSGEGGQLEYDEWFSGPMAFFGGIEYQTPHLPLRVKVEYDPNDYSRDFAGDSVTMTTNTPINVGLNYRATDWLDLQAAYERGNTFTFGFTARLNFNDQTPARVARAPRGPRSEPRYETLDDVRWRNVNDRIQRQHSFISGRYYVSENASGTSEAAEGSAEPEHTVTLYANPLRFRDRHEMIDRTARVLAGDMPESVKTYEIVEQYPFNPMVLTRIDAEAFKTQISNEDPDNPPNETGRLFERDNAGERPPFGNNTERDNGYWAHGAPYRFTNNYGVKPYFKQDFGSPETFHFYQLGATVFANRFITEKLEVFGEVGVDIVSNYHRFNFNVDHFRSPVPRVRTWVREYVDNDVWMDRLEANYYERFSDNLYGMVYGGYLERMFAGVGGELLYRQLDQPWAIGVDITRVRQRDFDGWEGFRDYEETTGFVSLYYQMPWLEDSQISLHAGQFLAGDRGVNVNFQRRFDSGVIVGAYASFTDVTSEEYGEGSFTKGFFLSIPFDLIGVRPTRQRVSFSWAPMTRDGGQMLQRRSTLYGLTDARHPFYFR